MTESPLFSTEEAAAYLRLAPSTLVTRRCRGGGPRFVKVGGRIYYRRADLDGYLDARTYDRTLTARAVAGGKDNAPGGNPGRV